MPAGHNSRQKDLFMAQAPKEDAAPVTARKRPLTWQEKLDANKPLNPLDEVKADADFNHNKRVRDEQEREEYEARKRGQRQPSEGGSAE